MAGGTKTHVRGKLRINVDGTFGHFVLAPRINDFLERYPELSVEIFVRDSIGDFVGEGTDVAVRFGEPGAHSMHTELLLETRTPEFHVAEAQNQARFHAALDSLDVMVRAVIFLKLREGMTNEEIAHHLAVTPRMVRRHLVTGYAELRARLTSE